jgi:fatty acid desaturase
MQWWSLYGKEYDLRILFKWHPGGKDILTSALESGRDLTSTFETYHPTYKMDKIHSMLEKSLLDDSTGYEQEGTFNKGEFYDTIRTRVNCVILNRYETQEWIQKIQWLSLSYMITLFTCIAFDEPLFVFANAMCMLSLIANVMHDAAHRAITNHKKWSHIANTLLAGHHTIVPERTVGSRVRMLLELMFLPGHFIATLEHQKLTYKLIGILPHILMASIWKSILFAIILGVVYITYMICARLNSQVKYDPKMDWGEIQVRQNTNTGGSILAWLTGGLNYRIEHHLFPTMCHIHYPMIAPIVRATCKEFKIPYQHISITHSIAIDLRYLFD